MTNALWRSAFLAAIFAIHPLHVESVAWIAERKDVLSGVFFVLTIWLYVHYTRRPGVLRYILLLICFAFGLMAKPMLVTLPFVLLLLDYWPLGRIRPGQSEDTGQSWLRVVVEKIPLLLLALAASIETVLSQHQSINLIKTVSLSARVANAFVSIIVYIGQTFWPTKLAVFYPHPGNNIPVWQVAAGVLLVSGVSIAVVALRNRAPYLLTGWFWFIGMLIPVIGIVQVGIQAHADRYMYLPQIGLSLGIIWGGANVARRVRYGRRVAGALLLGALIALTCVARAQTSYWRDSQSLWEHTLAITPNNEMAHEHLADAYLDKQRIDDAITQATAAVEGNPDSADAHATLGAALARKGEFDQAIGELESALRLNPKLARAHYNLANVWLQKGEVDRAIENYEIELQMYPQFVEAENNLASALLRKGNFSEAQQHLRAALQLDPNNAEAHNNLGIALSQTGQMAAAIAEWNKTLQIQPDNLEAQCNLAWIYATFPDSSIRDGSRAVTHAERALGLSAQKNARIWRLAAAAYAEAGRFDEAIKAARNGAALAQAAGDTKLAETLEANIRLFEEKTPLRDASSKSDSR
jgi:tetratricopeptide (TPR) repeat protein